MLFCNSRSLACALALGSLETTSSAQITLVEHQNAAGLLDYVAPLSLTTGCAAADYDNDGDIDVFIPNGKTVADQLYRNLGNGTFEEIASTAGVASTENNRGALWFDYDGDGDLDLLVSSDTYREPDLTLTTSLRLYRQDNPTQFTEVTSDAGLMGALNTGVDAHIGGLAAADVDNDNDLDFVITYWHGLTHLFINNGQGGFTNGTSAAGFYANEQTCWQPIFHDFNRDGWIDLFVAVDFNTNDFWLNNGDGTFTDICASLNMENDGANDMGATLGDPDGDGDLDLYVTNTYDGGIRRCTLWRNDTVAGILDFTSIEYDAGVADGGFGWGTSFADLDNDSWQDLVACNGRLAPDVTRIFRNDAVLPLQFTDIAASAGVTGTETATCIVAFDYDRDGDSDLLQIVYREVLLATGGAVVPGPVFLWRNDPAPGEVHGSYLVIKPRMPGTMNTHAIGATVTIDLADHSIARVITAGTSMLGQEPAEAHFGLGDAATVDAVRVAFPDGEVVTFADVAANQTLVIEPAGITCPADFDDSNTVNVFDLLELLSAWGPSPGHPADLTGDDVVNVFDLLELLAAWGPCD